MDERQLISKGYKPEMRDGQKVFCRRDDELGSRIGSVKHCATVEQWKQSQQAGREETESIQRTQVNPTGH
jgi:hypothetical protein